DAADPARRLAREPELGSHRRAAGHLPVEAARLREPGQVPDRPARRDDPVRLDDSRRLTLVDGRLSISSRRLLSLWNLWPPLRLAPPHASSVLPASPGPIPGAP